MANVVMNLALNAILQGNSVTLFDVWIPLTVFAWGVGLILRFLLRQPNLRSQKPELDIYQQAYLVGGAQRALIVALAQLVQQGYLRPNLRQHRLEVAQSSPADAPILQQQVMQQVLVNANIAQTLDWPYPHYHEINQQLTHHQLLIFGAAARWRTRLISGWLLACLALLCLTGLLIYQVEHFPQAIPPEVALTLVEQIMIPGWIAWGLVSIVVLCCWIPYRKTRWGDRLTHHLIRNYDPYDLAQSVMVHGDRVLSGGTLGELRKLLEIAARYNS
jgi:uncharacterized protein (TIGR04222 family)